MQSSILVNPRKKNNLNLKQAEERKNKKKIEINEIVNRKIGQFNGTKTGFEMN